MENQIAGTQSHTRGLNLFKENTRIQWFSSIVQPEDQVHIMSGLRLIAYNVVTVR